ncbi:MAG: hypothetical protein ACP5PQ_05290 [Thermoproteota archaeon]
MRRSSSVRCFAILEAFFPDSSKAGMAYLSMKPDETLKVKGLRASSRIEGSRVILKIACERGLMSLAYTLFEYLHHLKMMEEAASRLEEAMCP